MNATPWRLPHAPLLASAVTSTVVGLLALLVLALMARTALPVGDLYPLKATAAFALSGYRSPTGRAVRAINARTSKARRPTTVEVTALASSGAWGRRHGVAFIQASKVLRFWVPGSDRSAIELYQGVQSHRIIGHGRGPRLLDRRARARGDPRGSASGAARD